MIDDNLPPLSVFGYCNLLNGIALMVLFLYWITPYIWDAIRGWL